MRATAGERQLHRQLLVCCAMDLPLAPRHVVAQGLVDRGVDCRRLVFRQQLLPNAIGTNRSVRRAAVLPVVVIVPIGQQRRVERPLIALERMSGAEEVAAMSDRRDGLET